MDPAINTVDDMDKLVYGIYDSFKSRDVYKRQADSKGNIWMGDNSSVICYYAAGSVLGNSFSSWLCLLR